MKILGLHRGNVARSYSKRVDRLRGGRPRRLGLDPLEDRCLLSATVPLPGGPAAPLITPPAAAAAQPVNLSISVSDNFGGNSATGTAGNAIPGDAVIYTLVVSNTGSAGTSGVAVSDTLPAALSGADLISVATSGGAKSSATLGFIGVSGTTNTIDLDTVDLRAGSSAIYVLTANIASSATGQLSNTITASPINGTVPSAPPNIAATDTDNLTPQGDLSVALSASDLSSTSSAALESETEVIEYKDGDDAAYTITVTNNGPSDVTGAAVSDVFPAALTNVTLQSVTTSGGATSDDVKVGNLGSTGQDGVELTDQPNLPTGGSVTYVVTGTIDSSAAPGPLADTATITAPAGFADTDPNANASTNSTSATVNDVVRPAANVTITATDSAGANSATGALGNLAQIMTTGTDTYTITVTNNGPDPVSGAVWEDSMPDFPVTTTMESVTTSGGATSSAKWGASWTWTGPWYNKSCSCEYDFGAYLPVGGSITYTVLATIGAPPAGTTVDNFQESFSFVPSPAGTAGGGTTFVSGGSATFTDAPPADLVVSLSGQTTAVSGHDVIYELQMTNYGPGTAQGIMVTYTVPDSITLVSAFDPTTLAPLPLTLLMSDPTTHTKQYGIQDSKNVADGAAKSQAVEGVFQAPSGGGTGSGTLDISASVSTLTAEAAVTTTAADGTATTISPVLSASFSTQLNVPGASLVPSILTAGATDLVVTGGTGTGHNSDGIAVSDQAKPTDTKPPRRRSHAAVIVTDEGKNLGTFAPTGRIIVYGGPTTSASQSTFEWVSPRITLPVLMYGGDGPGASYLFGGGGNNVIVGGSGPNQGPTYIWGGPNYNLLIGGSGGGSINAPLQRKWLPANFRLKIDGLMAAAGGGAASNNLEVAGSTIYDNNQLALNAIMTEWSNPADSLIQRVAEITSGIPNTAGYDFDGDGKADPAIYLNSQTIQVAAATEYLFGSLSGDNLFFAGNNDYISAAITNPLHGMNVNVVLKNN